MLRETCRSSDRVLALSTVLRDRLNEWAPAELFYPWATIPYRTPVGDEGTSGRDTLLFWGYVDVGVDTDAIRRISRRLASNHPNLKIVMVGPTQSPSRRRRTTRNLEDLANVEIRSETPLHELPTDRVLAALIPYRRKGDADAVELPNKVPQLLAYGLPILKTGMPNAIDEPFVISVDDDQSLDAGIEACRSNFSTWQRRIQAFLGEHSASARLASLRVDPAR
jgi:hypothetical protein